MSKLKGQIKPKVQSLKRVLAFGFWILFVIWVLVFGFAASAQEDVNESESPLEVTGTIPARQDGRGTTYPDAEVPIVYPRSTWENGDLAKLLSWFPQGGLTPETATSTPPDYAPATRIVFHDTGCRPSSPACNSDTVDPIFLIQNMFRFHAVTRGWGDIGYNYIVDRQGRVYEGRFGGNGVRAAHLYHDRKCDNFNVGTIGIVLLGNYSAADPPAAMVQGANRLVGWLSAANSLDPQELSKTTSVWHNPKTGPKSCDFTQGSMSSTFTGPVVAGHGEIEEGNPDPGRLDLVEVRAAGKTLATAFQNYLFRTDAEPATFAIRQGSLVKIGATEAEAKSVMPSATVLTISRTQRDIFSLSNATLLTNGSLMRSYNRPEVYLVDGGKKRVITSATLFNRNGYDWNNIQTLTDRELGLYPAGDPIIWPDGTLVREAGNPKVYLVEEGKKRHLTSAHLFGILNVNSKSVLMLETGELRFYPLGKPLVFPDGTAIRDPKGRVYLVENGEKRYAPTPLKGKKIVSLDQTAIDAYPDGPSLPYPNGSLLADAEGKVLYIKNQLTHWITNPQVFRTLGFSWKKVIKLPARDFSVYGAGANIASVAEFRNLDKRDKALAATPPAPSVPSTPSTGSTSSPQASSETPNGPSIRVGITELAANAKFQITANVPFQVLENGNIFASKWAGETATIFADATNTYRFTSSSPGPVFEVLTYTDTSRVPDINFNKFRGALEVAYSQVSKKIWLLNEIPMEDYLKGLGEALNQDHPEYRKAFQIAARSYAMFHLQNGGKRPGEIYHLNNTASDQVYKGYNMELRTPNLGAAVEETKGIRLGGCDGFGLPEMGRGILHPAV
ncbi:N-acetylmuramoyl-L-alanine amidase [Candidatus Azambacteria bacterium]|nr:N-acetylmuramoyl-L-alanine amidase [Candidatus Azambacteria bacterium]